MNIIKELWQYGISGYLTEESMAAYVIWAPILCAVCAYLLGSFNFSLLISKKKGSDIRNSGSGNAGATNMMRVYGKKYAIMTFVGDFLKAVVANIIGRILFGVLGAYIAGLFCIIGHAFPLYFKFKGGKGVVTLAAMGFMTEPLLTVILLVLFVFILFAFKMVSLASVMIALIYPFAIYMLRGEGLWFLIALAVAILVIFLHRKNLVRIFNHTESKFKFKFKKKEKKSETIEETQDKEIKNEEDKE
ncbi:MAG: glycerol-3-phosphate 1-O-acyltransferase PlsY [Clostridia bacterium]|nr:glycerol-3-phosphate 1-O-acyltransferase PlsY [Clostridia bacterium]